jgi:hypothetical protein
MPLKRFIVPFPAWLEQEQSTWRQCGVSMSRVLQSPLRSNPVALVFARYLNTSESTVEKWETGAKRPSGMALKLLDIVEKHGLKMLA